MENLLMKEVGADCHVRCSACWSLWCICVLNQFNENAENFTLWIKLVHDCALKMSWKL